MKIPIKLIRSSCELTHFIDTCQYLIEMPKKPLRYSVNSVKTISYSFDWPRKKEAAGAELNICIFIIN